MAHLILQAKVDKDIPEADIYMADEVSEQSLLEYRLAGSAKDIGSSGLTQVQIFGMGTHIKFIFRRPREEEFYGNGRAGSLAHEG